MMVLSTTENKILMTRARESLKGQWGLAIGTFFLFFLIVAGVQAIPLIGSLIMLFIYGSMAIGIGGFSLSLSRNQKTKTSEIFDGFQKFGVGLGAYFLTTIFIFLWMILLIIPGFIASLSYSMTFFIIADNDSIGALEAIRKSKEMMKGNKWKLFCLWFRFSGWLILCILSLGIGFLWIMPYMGISFAKFYDDLKNSEFKPNDESKLKKEEEETSGPLPPIEGDAKLESHQKTAITKPVDRDVKSELKKYKEMLNEGLITQEQYNAKSNDLLDI